MKVSSAILFLGSTLVSSASACVTVIVDGPLIIAPSASNLQLTGAVGNQATLTIAGLSHGWNFANGGLGAPQFCTNKWLNIIPSTKPWKKVSWGAAELTTTWKTGYDYNLTAAKTANYNETSTFLACDPNYETFAPEKFVFLLTDDTSVLPLVGDDVLGDVDLSSCVKTKLHIQPAGIA